MANLFFRARDFSRAAYCCEHLEEPIKAAQLYERCDDWPQAAQMYAAAGPSTSGPTSRPGRQQKEHQASRDGSATSVANVTVS